MSNPYGSKPPQGGAADRSARQPPGPGGRPVGPAARNPPRPPAAPIVWDDEDLPESASWSGPGAFTPTAPPSAHRSVRSVDARPPQDTPPPAPERPAPAGGQGPAGSQGPAGAATMAAAAARSGGGEQQSADDEELTIGRAKDNSIVLDDMLVSRRHLRITADDEGLLLEDLGSRNGTFVNGRQVDRTHLHEGDRIGVGSATFEVRDGWLVTV